MLYSNTIDAKYLATIETSILSSDFISDEI